LIDHLSQRSKFILFVDTTSHLPPADYATLPDSLSGSSVTLPPANQYNPIPTIDNANEYDDVEPAIPGYVGLPTNVDDARQNYPNVPQY
jgi:hypothetical protein